MAIRPDKNATLPLDFAEVPAWCACWRGDDRHFAAVSPAWAEQTGWSEADLLGEPFLEFVHADDRPLADLAANGDPVEFEARFKIMGDGYRWLAWKARPRTDGTWLCVVDDVDDHVRTEARLRVQYSVARVLAEAASVAEAEPHILEELCRAESWQLGSLWWVDKDAGVIRCGALWHEAGAPTSEIERASRTTTFRPGDGIPGYVWTMGEPIWIPDFNLEGQFPRSLLAAASGLRCACAFPIFVGPVGREVVVGVIELFAIEPRAKNDLNLEMMRHIGSQLGQFARRRGAEESLVSAEKRLEYVVANAPLILLAVETDGRVVLHQGAGLGISGDLLGRSLFDMYFADDPASHPLVAQVRRALTGEAFDAVIELSPTSASTRSASRP